MGPLSVFLILEILISAIKKTDTQENFYTFFSFACKSTNNMANK